MRTVLFPKPVGGCLHALEPNSEPTPQHCDSCDIRPPNTYPINCSAGGLNPTIDLSCLLGLEWLRAESCLRACFWICKPHASISPLASALNMGLSNMIVDGYCANQKQTCITA